MSSEIEQINRLTDAIPDIYENVSIFGVRFQYKVSLILKYTVQNTMYTAKQTKCRPARGFALNISMNFVIKQDEERSIC